jgi:hypothetical protein
MNSDIFEPMPKIPRLNREMIVTEKIDGTNASIHIWEHPELGMMIRAASRNRWLSVDNDNYGFAKWVQDHEAQLLQLGPGRHFGEWWGVGINRGYGLSERRFSLFNVSRWDQEVWNENQKRAAARHNPPPYESFKAPPPCCSVVPVLLRGPFDTRLIKAVLDDLEAFGSSAAHGFANPEGVVIFHDASRQLFKVTLLNDEQPKSKI